MLLSALSVILFVEVEDMNEKQFFKSLLLNRSFTLALFFNLAEGAVRIVLSVAGGSLVDLAGRAAGAGMLWTFSVSVLLGAAIFLCVTAKESFYVRSLEGKIFEMKAGLFERLTHIPLQALKDRPVDELVSARLNDVNALSNALRPLVVMCFSLVVMRVEAALFLFWKDPFVTVATLSLSPALLVFQNHLSRPVKKQKQAELAAAQELLGEAARDFEAQEYIKSAGLETRMATRFAKKQGRQLQALLRLRKLEAIQGAVSYLSEWAPRLMLVTAGAWQIASGAMTAGDLVVFAALSGSATRLFAGFADLKVKLEQARACLQRATKKEPQEQEQQLEPGAPGEAVAFSHVTFGYEPASPVLTDCSFSIPEGETVRFCGPSGCGKSTALGILCGFYTPQQGEIRVAGAKTLAELRSRIAYVPQKPFLFDGTVYENIACVNPGLSRSQAQVLLEKLGMKEWLRGQRAGLDTPVGERGARLSGGQRQRVAIARALAKDAQILILDEATAGLDRENEQRVYQTLAAVCAQKKGLTVILVTHQPVPLPNIRKISFGGEVPA